MKCSRASTLRTILQTDLHVLTAGDVRSHRATEQGPQNPNVQTARGPRAVTGAWPVFLLQRDPCLSGRKAHIRWKTHLAPGGQGATSTPWSSRDRAGLAHRPTSTGIEGSWALGRFQKDFRKAADLKGSLCRCTW